MSLTVFDERNLPYDLEHLRPEDVSVELIASRLAQINRYAGALPHPFSDAAHSVLVSYLCPEDPLAGLLHDTAEAFVGDVISPVKRRTPAFRYMEQGVHVQLCALNGWPSEHTPHVKRADTRAWELECAYIKGRYPVGAQPASPHEARLARALCVELDWRVARDMFLRRYRTLTGARATCSVYLHEQVAPGPAPARGVR
jgi:hypothetical protein